MKKKLLKLIGNKVIRYTHLVGNNYHTYIYIRSIFGYFKVHNYTMVKVEGEFKYTEFWYGGNKSHETCGTKSHYYNMLKN